ncbi:MAG: (5-formylfuran-3-yl)methyl phosphate synthase, partial [Pseudolabrys sp.]
MTMLLASVTGTQEAELALSHGADIIDLKDPDKGALGALPIDAVRETVGAIAGRRPVSAVTGDLPAEPRTVADTAEAMAETGVDYVKVGLFAGPRRPDCIRALKPIAGRSRIVGVLFADDEPDTTLLPLMAEAGFAGAMLDTARKGSGRLLDHADLSMLGEFVRLCRVHGMLAGLAGSLEAPDVPRLLLLAPDYIGFRGALCAGHDRRAGLDPAALGLIRALIPSDPRSVALSPPAPHKSDYTLLAGGYSGDPAKDGSGSDRVLVHDFTLPVHIGVYENEREAAQDVRFNVVAEVNRASQPASDMRDVLSYDIITDGIRLIAAAGHIPLVETLAERIANFVLAHPRVQAVTVKVEKL